MYVADLLTSIQQLEKGVGISDQSAPTILQKYDSKQGTG